jgi:hypothetical protein
MLMAAIATRFRPEVGHDRLLLRLSQGAKMA